MAVPALAAPARVKGWCNHRWIVGVRLCWLLNDRGEVVAWSWGGASAHDRRFLPLVAALDGRSVTLAGAGFLDPPGVRSRRTSANLSRRGGRPCAVP